MTRIMLATALALAACNSTTTTFESELDGGASDSSAGASSPCGPTGVFGAFPLKGTLDGTESICGLSLGTFDGASLTIAEGSSSGATVTITGSHAGHIDVSACAATVTGCAVSASCAGSTDRQSSVTVNMNITATDLRGSSQLGFNGCEAPGLSFTGTR